MKKFQNYLWILVLPMMACSSNRLAQQAGTDDNVYVSRARAKEAQPYARPSIGEDNYKTESEVYRDDQSSGRNYNEEYDYYDGMSYSSRINRFHYYSPWRNFYDPWYDDFRFDPFYDRYYFDSFYYRNDPNWSFNLYVGPSWGGFYPYRYNSWSYYYSPYRYGGYWGVYSYYNPVPYFPGYYGGNYVYPYYPGNTRINRPKPYRGSENWYPNNSTGNGGFNNGSRAGRYEDNIRTPQPGNGGRSTSPNAGSRPSRVQENQRPSRQEKPNNSGNKSPESGQSRPSRAEQYNSPKSTSSRNTDSNTNSAPRPARSGGRR